VRGGLNGSEATQLTSWVTCWWHHGRCSNSKFNSYYTHSYYVEHAFLMVEKVSSC